MMLGLSENLTRLKEAGGNAAGHLARLSQAHAALLQLEVKDQLRILTGVIVSASLGVIAGGVALVLGSFAAAGAIHNAWPALTQNDALATVAAGNVILMFLLFAIAKGLFQRISLFCFESIKSWKESVSCIMQKI